MSGLTIRQHERKSIELDIELVVHEQHRQQLCFSPGSTAVDSWTVRGKAVDISPGGMGLILEHYVPKMCEGRVRVYSPVPVGSASDGSPVFDVIFEHDVKFRRLAMDTHTPTYAAGVSFVDPEPGLETLVQEVLMIGEMAASQQRETDDA